jgi:hypothetical protein
MKSHNRFASIGSLPVAVVVSSIGVGWFSVTVKAEMTPVKAATTIAYVQNDFAYARTEVPVTQVTFVEQDGEVRGAQFMVPDEDTTQSAFGGKLRRYDMHIAKMMAITDYECRQPDRMWSRITWHYQAGNIEMGKVSISCDLARDTAVSYGFVKPELMPVTYYNSPAVLTIPALNITGAKVEKWMNFTEGFRPAMPVAGK